MSWVNPIHSCCTAFILALAFLMGPVAMQLSWAEQTTFYTYPSPDGNRWIRGRGALPQARPVVIDLAGYPVWLVAGPWREGSLWVAALQDGRIQAFYVESEGHRIESVDLEPSHLPAGQPPVLSIADGKPRLLRAPAGIASRLSPATALSENRLAFLGPRSDLVIWREQELARLAVTALPDARILSAPPNRLLLLTDPTRQYDHGVLGDGVEAQSVTLIDSGPTPQVLRSLTLPKPEVAEGLAPIWADLTGDGVRDIVLTLSDPHEGARLVVYNQSGQIIATGVSIGQVYRWRHQIAVAPFGPAGETELVSVRTPHLGGVVEYDTLDGAHLRHVAVRPGHTPGPSDAVQVAMRGFNSHALGSRNLDMALAGDFDADGRVELLVPNQSRSHLAGIRRHANGASVVWALPLEGQLSTNLAAVRFADGGLAVGAGHSGRSLKLWLPSRQP